MTKIFNNVFLLSTAFLFSMNAFSNEEMAIAEMKHEPSAIQNQEIMIEGAWLRAMPPSQKISAAFMTIYNLTKTDKILISASTNFTKTVEIHLSEMSDGIMSMQKQESLTIAAGKSKLLKPGGFHLMLMGVTEPLNMGDEKSIVLKFSDGTDLIVELPVKMMADSHKSDSMAHHKM